VADSVAIVTAAFQVAAADGDRLVQQTQALPSIWDDRLRLVPVHARILSSSRRGQRGWAMLRLTPGFRVDVAQFAVARSGHLRSVRVVLANVAPTARVVDL
jgi:hypothetical protein